MTVDAIVNVSNWWNSVANAFGKYHIEHRRHTYEFEGGGDKHMCQPVRWEDKITTINMAGYFMLILCDCRSIFRFVFSVRLVGSVDSLSVCIRFVIVA